jgi:heme/copper-type cytochrome/quinol oxidase subunit 1
MFFGVNITFLPMHFLGLNGIPRRYSDYPDIFLSWNVVCSVGSALSLSRMVLLLIVLLEAVTSGRVNIYSQSLRAAQEWT